MRPETPVGRPDVRISPSGRGVKIWVRGHVQSYQRKAAHAQAMAEVLKATPLLEGLRIYAGGRLD